MINLKKYFLEFNAAHVKLNKKIFVLAIVIIFSLYRAFLPFEEDQKIFFAAAFQSFGSDLGFPYDILSVFELKPFYSRLLFYFVVGTYKIIFGEQINLSKFIIYAQILLVILINVSSIVFSKNITLYSLDAHEGASYHNKYLLYVFISIALLTPSSEAFFQIDHIAIILLLLSIGLILSNLLVVNGVGVIVLSIVAGLKGISYIYLFTAISFLVLCFSPSFKIKVALGISFVLSTFVIISILPDLINAITLQSHGANIGKIINNFPFRFWKLTLLDLPILIFGLPLSIILIFIHIKNIGGNRINKTNVPIGFKKNLGILIIIASGIIYSLLQVGYSYHYFGYVSFVLLVCTYFFVFNNSIKFINAFKIISFAPLIIFIIFSGGLLSPISSHFPSLRKYSFYDANINNLKSELAVFDEIKIVVGKANKVLFLTDGVANFFMYMNKSACYEFYPLSINRLLPGGLSSAMLNARFSETYECISSFRGEWILLQNSWLPYDSYALIYPNMFYEVHSSYHTSERKYTLFNKKN